MSESDSDPTMFFSRPEGLARILSLDDEETELWSPEEMKAMWLHQMATPLEIELGTITPAPASGVQEGPFSGKTFRDLLSHPEPPLRLLEMTKEFSKRTLKESDDKQLKEIASGLYYASYAAALTRCGRSLGSLKDHHLVAGFSWALERPWLDEQTRTLITQAVKQVAAKS
jgi:hypothetical protein